MFTSPVFILGSTLASISSALFHLFFGRRALELVLYWFVGLLGFFAGQLAGEIIGLDWLMIGQVHLVEATVTCWATLFVVRWLRA